MGGILARPFGAEGAREKKSRAACLAILGVLLLTVLPGITLATPTSSVPYSPPAVCTPPSGEVCFTITLRISAGPAPSTSVPFGLSGCGISVGTIVGNGRPVVADASPSCTFTISAPSPTADNEVQFTNLEGSIQVTTCATSASSVCPAIVRVYYDDVLVTYSYSLIGGGSPNAPVLYYSEWGGIHSQVLSDVGTFQAFTDVGTTVAATNPLYDSSITGCPPANPNSLSCPQRWYTATSRLQVTSTTTTFAPVYYDQVVATFSASPILPPVPEDLSSATVTNWGTNVRIPVYGDQGGVLHVVCTMVGLKTSDTASCSGYVDSGSSPTFAAYSNEFGGQRWYFVGAIGSTGYYVNQFLLVERAIPFFGGHVMPGTEYVTATSSSPASVTISETPCTIGTLDCTFQGWAMPGQEGLNPTPSPTVSVSKPTSVSAVFSIARDDSCTVSNQEAHYCSVYQLPVFLNKQGSGTVCMPGSFQHPPYGFSFGGCPRIPNTKPPQPSFPPNCVKGQSFEDYRYVGSGLACVSITGGAPFDRGVIFFGNLTTYSSYYGVTAFPGGAVRYFDIAFVGFSRSTYSSTVASVCFAQGGVSNSDGIFYWNGASWTEVSSSIISGAICTDVGIPLSDLAGTNIAIAVTSPVTTTTSVSSSTSLPTTSSTYLGGGGGGVAIYTTTNTTSLSSEVPVTSTTSVSSSSSTAQQATSTTTPPATTTSTTSTTSSSVFTPPTTSSSTTRSTSSTSSTQAIAPSSSGALDLFAAGGAAAFVLLLILGFALRRRKKKT